MVKIPNTKFVVAAASFKMVLVIFVLRSQTAGEGGGEEEEEKVKSVGRRKWMTHCRPFQVDAGGGRVIRLGWRLSANNAVRRHGRGKIGPVSAGCREPLVAGEPAWTGLAPRSTP